MSIPPPPEPLPPAPIDSPFVYDREGKIRKRRSLKRKTQTSGGRINLADEPANAKTLLGE